MWRPAVLQRSSTVCLPSRAIGTHSLYALESTSLLSHPSCGGTDSNPGGPHGVNCNQQSNFSIASRRPVLLRPSAWTLHPLLHGDVGALQLLRNAGAAHLVHDGGSRSGRARLRHCEGGVYLRTIY